MMLGLEDAAVQLEDPFKFTPYGGHLPLTMWLLSAPCRQSAVDACCQCQAGPGSCRFVTHVWA
jgi:hypothetical protein